MNKYIFRFRIFLWLALVIIISWLFYMAVVPFGKINYVYDFKKSSRFIGKLTPEDRVKPITETGQKIIGDPVYFSLRLPRGFQKARLILKYRTAEENSASISVIEAGVLVDKIIWRYDLAPIENKIIDGLALAWQVIENNDTLFLQKEKKYSTIEEFLNNLPTFAEIALYNYDLGVDYLLPDYIKDDKGQVINYSLRGPYQFYTYLKDEDLDFNFTFLDLNKNKDSDPVDLHLYYRDKLIDSRHLDDDGIAKESGEAGGERVVNFNLKNLPEGAYKIEIRANDDIVTKKIITGQSKLSFLNKIQLAGEGKDDIKMYTDSNELRVQTIRPDSLQTIKIGDKNLKIDETYRQFSSLVSGPLPTEINLAKDGIILAGDGVFSFSQDSLINPGFKKITLSLDIPSQGINYVLAKYSSPKEEGEWKTGQAEFNLTRAYQEKGKYSFIISIPGLRADDEIDDWIEVSEIKVELEGKSLMQKMREIFSL